MNSSSSINRFKLTQKLTIGNSAQIDLFIRPYLYIYLGYYEKEALRKKAGVEISTHLGNLLLKSILREDIKLGDFEAILEMAAYNLDGGLSKSSLIEAHVIDHFIPFLPLEKSHIYQCLYAEFDRNMKPYKEVLDEIVGNVVTYDPIHSVFAKSGCKKLDKKLAVVAYRRGY